MGNKKSEIDISLIIKKDRKLLITSVKNLTIILKKYLSTAEHDEIILKQKNESFWRTKNLCKFYDFYLKYWNEKRLTKLN